MCGETELGPAAELGQAERECAPAWHTPEVVRGFAPMPLQALPFPSIVVASEDDPYVSMARARQFAEAWGSRIENIGPAGHINAESGLGNWPDGLALLESLCVTTHDRSVADTL